MCRPAADLSLQSHSIFQQLGDTVTTNCLLPGVIITVHQPSAATLTMPVTMPAMSEHPAVLNMTRSQDRILYSHIGHAQLSSLIWIVLFWILMLLSMVTNTVYVTTVFTCKRKLTTSHLLLCFFFLINLVDYGLLIFEFSLGPGSQYPYSDGSCSFYQFLLQGSPLLSSGTLLLLVYQAYSSLSQPHH